MWKLAIFLLLLPPVVHAESRQDKAEHELSRVDSWQRLDEWRAKYALEYDDGYFSDDIEGFVEKMLTDNWPSIRDLVRLSKRSPGLFTFTINHLNTVTSCEGTKAILESATTSCPAGYDRYCHQIVRQLDTAETAPECRPAQLQPNN